MAGDLTSSVYSLVVLSYATVVFVKFGHEPNLKRMRNVIPPLKELWESEECAEMLKSTDEQTSKDLQSNYDNVIASTPLEKEPHSKWNIFWLATVLFTCPIILLLEVVRIAAASSAVDKKYAWVPASIEPYVLVSTIADYIVFIVVLGFIFKNSWGLSKEVNCSCNDVRALIDQINLVLKIDQDRREKEQARRQTSQTQKPATPRKQVRPRKTAKKPHK